RLTSLPPPPPPPNPKTPTLEATITQNSNLPLSLTLFPKNCLCHRVLKASLVIPNQIFCHKDHPPKLHRIPLRSCLQKLPCQIQRRSSSIVFYLRIYAKVQLKFRDARPHVSCRHVKSSEVVGVVAVMDVGARLRE
ncbi:hypothetical protein PIB30_080779, partial [Stylosanthes scabra]|nr:hypothetical protein [Stylosanthes scabra]